MRRYWQVAAGSGGRDYSEEFLRFGMAFVGTDKDKMEETKEGDIVVLKSGVSKIRAVGRIVKRQGKVCHEDSEWLHDFDGWELPVNRYVQWCKADVPVTGLTRGTMREIHSQTLKDVADTIVDGSIEPEKHKSPPEPTAKVDGDTLISFLIAEGLSVSQADELTNTIARIKRLADYYYASVRWEQVREHETRTFLVVPLLLALGWAEQQLKIELPCGGRKTVDIAGFRRPYKGTEDHNKNCTLIIETKGFSSGLTYAVEQGKSPTCQYRVRQLPLRV